MKSQSGNVLVFILIAIVLIGVLTVSLSRSSNTSNDTGGFEQNQIAVTEILRYAKSVEVGVQNLLARGCSENELSFWHDSDGNGVEDASDDYFNPISPTDRSCHIFDSAGMGLIYVLPKSSWLDSARSAEMFYNQFLFSDVSCVDRVGSTEISSNCANDGNKNNIEIMLFLPHIKIDICALINKNQSIQEISQDTGKMYESNATSFFNGFFEEGSNIGSVNSGTEMDGVYTACIEGDAVPAGGYHFYHVLHAR